MWPLMFYAGYLLFSRMTPARRVTEAEQHGDEVEQTAPKVAQ
jgi:hypothetical protein